jgi:hypothetical protein
MTDDKRKVGREDRARIDVNEYYELQTWAEKFGVSPGTLRDAVSQAGDMADDVAAFLRSRGLNRSP